MKRIFCSLFLVGAVAFGLTSCGGEKKEEAKQEETEDAYDDYETAAPEEEASAQDLIAQGKTLADASDCKTCHHATNKLVGPAHTEVAKKYEFTKANVSYLADKIINGGSGVWGEIPMSPHVGMSKGDAEKMAMYVLSLDGEEPKD